MPHDFDEHTGILTVEEKVKVFDLVLRRHLKTRAPQQWLAAALQHAVSADDGNVFFTKLLAIGASPDSVCSGRNEKRILHVAASGDNQRAVELLLEYGADVNTADRFGRTALHRAAKSDQVGTIGLLVRAGADVTRENAHWETPLDVASVENRLDSVTALCQLGADANRRGLNGLAPLHRAVCRPDGYGVVIALLACGADVHLRQRSGRDASALEMAAQFGHEDMMRALMQKGADVTAAAGANDLVRGITALHYAAGSNRVGAVSLLVAAGASVEATDGQGRTPLHWASGGMSTEAANALLQNGANVNALSEKRQLPLHGACSNSSENSGAEMVKLLLRWGADETHVDDNGKTAAALVGTASLAETGKPPGKNDLVLARLAKAPADRVWRRRGFAVMCRARINRPQPEPSGGDEACGGACSESPHKRARLATAGGGGDAAGTIGDQGIAHWGVAESASVGDDDLHALKRVVEMDVDDVLRGVVGFL